LQERNLANTGYAIEFTADLPKTASGKIRRRALRDREFAAQSFLAKKEEA